MYRISLHKDRFCLFKFQYTHVLHCDLIITDWFPIFHLCVHQLRPAGMVVEVSNHERHICIPSLSDRFTVVESLNYAQETLMLLNVAGDTEKMLSIHLKNIFNIGQENFGG